LGSGLPVVAPKIGGIPEIVTDECGVLLHPADPDKLGEAIMQAMSRTWRRTMISSCAQQYNFNNIAPRIMSIYSKIARG
jgi:glycosyltransferase involved in cell wall biosynthesis